MKAIEPGVLIMQSGEQIEMPDDVLYVDCTASAVDFKHPPKRAVFDGNLITIQGVRIPNPCLSAAITAYVECHYDNDEERNRLCPPVTLPDDELGFCRSTFGNMMNQAVWSGEPELRDFITNNRLDGFGAVIRDADLSDPENVAIIEKMQANIMPAVGKLQQLIAETEQAQ